jgi:chemotaxis protein MotB
MVRRPIQDEEDNPERWLVSYADFITLLFAFFVVMYSVSSVNQGKYKELTASINIAFTNTKPKQENQTQTTVDTSSPIDQIKTDQTITPPLPSTVPTEAQQLEVNAMTRFGKALSNQLSSQIKAGKVRIIQNARGLRVDIKDSLLFTNGSADLAETAKSLLNVIVMPLLKGNHAILVEGHTDNTPIFIQNATFFSNWELSAVRASSVVSMLNELGIENIRLSALGYGASQPISDNITLEGREANRHVSIMILYDSLIIATDDDIEINPD